MLKVGDDAPDFECPVGDGGQTRLHDLLQRGPVILYFYPMDFTPVCTSEACLFRDAYVDLVERGLRVIGVNTMGESSHERFRKKYQLPFPLVADTGKTIVKAYGAAGLFGLMTHRVSYLIGKDRKIEDVAHGDFALGPHERFLERALALQKEDP
jgi:peroxiredoxin Q/BCP